MAWNHAPGLKLTSGAFLILNKKRANIANCGMIKTRPAAYLVKWNLKARGFNMAWISIYDAAAKMRDDLIEAQRRIAAGEPFNTTAAEIGFTPDELRELLHAQHTQERELRELLDAQQRGKGASDDQTSV